ncbi:MAG TPA: deoxyribonuclease IV [Candidatus Thermoplasmatota archaeon]|nr:deoxyribonuclease IV [Candidatus Thermoplasmatota archaeon]
MLFGCHVSTQGGVEMAPMRGRELGCEVIQLFSKNQMQWAAKPLGETAVQTFRQGTKTHELQHGLIHASYLLNLASQDDALWNKSIDGLVVEVERAHMLGIPWVVFHPGSPKDCGSEYGCERVAQGVVQALDRTKGLTAGILLETNAGQGACVGRTFEELRAMLDGIAANPRVGICFDTCHTFVAGYPIHTEEGYEETFRRFDEVIGLQNLKAFHLNDSKQPLGSNKDRHEVLGSGLIGLPTFERLARDPRFRDLPGYLETPGGDENYAREIAMLKKFRDG